MAVHVRGKESCPDLNSAFVRIGSLVDDVL